MNIFFKSPPPSITSCELLPNDDPIPNRCYKIGTTIITDLHAKVNQVLLFLRATSTSPSRVRIGPIRPIHAAPVPPPAVRIRAIRRIRVLFFDFDAALGGIDEYNE